ncbi:MAG TPA: YbhN family protein [Actinomycetota bacterium]|nr:YbhN family protein [Actinomycetota bacterium]
MDERPVRGPAGRRKRVIRVVQVAISLAVVLGIFVGIIPKIASYSEVWKSLGELTWLELATVLAATAFNLWTYWLQMVAAMPGLKVSQAAVNNQSSTTVANLFPGGGAIAVGVAYGMFRSWGFSTNDIALMVAVTGVWNTFLKLALPVAALGLVAVTGGGSTLLVPALIGLAVLVGAVGVFAAMLWKKEMARAVGARLGRIWSWVRRLFRKPPVTSWGDGAVRFRTQTIGLVRRRWLSITLTTLVSHLALYLVLLLALRHIGVSEAEISWAQVLGVFAFVRLISAVPITPGGLGLVELGYIGGLVLAGRGHADVPLAVFEAQVAAAVLLFRALTYGIQIPLGGLTYLIWQRKKSWRKGVPAEPVSAPAPIGA